MHDMSFDALAVCIKFNTKAQTILYVLKEAAMDSLTFELQVTVSTQIVCWLFFLYFAVYIFHWYIFLNFILTYLF